MGLLSRAADRSVSDSSTIDEEASIDNASSIDDTASIDDEESVTLDEMGKALKERLKRLPRNKATPYTALSLLKAYGSFQIGICFSLKYGVYSSYASVGLGIERIFIPQERIWSEEKARGKYFKVDTPESLGIKTGKSKYIYWVFPLGDGTAAQSNPEPWGAVMILGVSELPELSSTFNPRPISVILEDVADMIILPAKREPPEVAQDIMAAGYIITETESLESLPFETASTEPDSVEPSSVEPSSVEQVPAAPDYLEPDSVEPSSIEPSSVEPSLDTLNSLGYEIDRYHQTHTVFNCVLLEIPDREEGKAYFSKKVSEMMSRTGTVIPLPSGRPLILLPELADRELIAHRLSKSLNTRPLVSINANSSENVLTQIHSLI